jgi:hypothetical protein
MARRLHGDLTVKRRPGGGAVLTIRSATGEAFEIERTPDQVADLRSSLEPMPDSEPALGVEANEAPQVNPSEQGKRRLFRKKQENSDA